MPRFRPSVNSGSFDPTEERSRIIAFCRNRIGDATVAEDIAQETLLVALRRQEAGFRPESWPPFLLGIARRLCLNHQRRLGRESEHLVTGEDLSELPVASPTDPLHTLIDAERSQLIDRALSHLKPGMRELIVARYLEEQSPDEIAARHRLTVNAAVVRLHRSREALERVLTTALREQANAHGLLPTEAASGWRESAMFCPRCGKSRLQGRFVTESGPPQFAMRCPTCTGQLVGMTTDARPLEPGSILAGVAGFRAGLNRVNRWWQHYLSSALATGKAQCVACGESIRAEVNPVTATAGMKMVCERCQGLTFFITPTGLLYHSDAFHTFWKRHPKLRNRPQTSLICEGRPAILATFEDPLGNAAVRIVYDAQTLRPMRTETNE